MNIKADENENRIKTLEDAGLEASYVSRNRQYEIRIDNFVKYEKQKEFLTDMVTEAKNGMKVQVLNNQ